MLTIWAWRYAVLMFTLRYSEAYAISYKKMILPLIAAIVIDVSLLAAGAYFLFTGLQEDRRRQAAATEEYMYKTGQIVGLSQMPWFNDYHVCQGKNLSSGAIGKCKEKFGENYTNHARYHQLYLTMKSKERMSP